MRHLKFNQLCGSACYGYFPVIALHERDITSLTAENHDVLWIGSNTLSFMMHVKMATTTTTINNNNTFGQPPSADYASWFPSGPLRFGEWSFLLAVVIYWCLKLPLINSHSSLKGSHERTTSEGKRDGKKKTELMIERVSERERSGMMQKKEILFVVM